MDVDAYPPFAKFLGLRTLSATKDRIEAELHVRDEIANRGGNMHGGAIMALADQLGGTATMLNLPEGAGTTTIESKTNFLRAIPRGATASAVCIPLHRGRTTMVWQTTISTPDGRPAAIVTQTQLVLFGRG
jgi:1,4-dihydroxy-2-naphthoyl-CoA hydrolase